MEFASIQIYLKIMKTRICIIILWFIGSIALIECRAQQVIYSSVNSAQVKYTVLNDKPTYHRDTVDNEFGTKSINESFTYKGFNIYFKNAATVTIRVMAGNSLIMLKPDDEYEVIEKLLTLRR
jgi:hypothetical protein